MLIVGCARCDLEEQAFAGELNTAFGPFMSSLAQEDDDIPPESNHPADALHIPESAIAYIGYSLHELKDILIQARKMAATGECQDHISSLSLMFNSQRSRCQ